MTFGNYLRDLRESRNLRQADLANSAGVSCVYLCDIEKGRRYPPDMAKLRIWVAQMALSPEEEARFYDLAGEARESAPPDISEFLSHNPPAREAIRRIIGQERAYDWDAIPPEERGEARTNEATARGGGNAY